MSVLKGTLKNSRGSLPGRFRGDWDASTNTPTLINPPTAAAGYREGDHWNVTTGGTFAGLTLTTGDTLYIIDNGSGGFTYTDRASGAVDTVNSQSPDSSGNVSLGIANIPSLQTSLDAKVAKYTNVDIDFGDSPYSASPFESIYVNTASGAVTIIPPTRSGNNGAYFRVERSAGSNTITITDNGAANGIDGRDEEIIYGDETNGFREFIIKDDQEYSIENTSLSNYARNLIQQKQETLTRVNYNNSTTPLIVQPNTLNIINSDTGTINVTLPGNADSDAGDIYIFKQSGSGANPIILNAASGRRIDQGNGTSYTFSATNDSVTLFDNGATYYIIIDEDDSALLADKVDKLTLRTQQASGSTILRNSVYTFDATSGNLTYNIQTGAPENAQILITKIDATANTITINPPAGETINFTTSIVIELQNTVVRLSKFGTNWIVEGTF